MCGAPSTLASPAALHLDVSRMSILPTAAPSPPFQGANPLSLSLGGKEILLLNPGQGHF